MFFTKKSERIPITSNCRPLVTKSKPIIGSAFFKNVIFNMKSATHTVKERLPNKKQIKPKPPKI
jgi:hypothetical protein